MKILNKVFFITTILICLTQSGFASKKANIGQPRTDFNGYLASRYLAYSQYKAENKNWKNSNYFAKKGARALRDEEVLPEDPVDWESRFILQNIDLNEFILARKDLDNILSTKLKQEYPLETANLQFLYDCWLSEESIYTEFDKISKCKVKFFVLKDYLEALITPKKEITKEEIEDEYLIGKRYIEEGVEYNVYFDFDSYKLNRNANQTIILLLNFLKTMKGDYTLVLEGHADRVGKKLYNQSLARKRVLTVKNKLKKNGIPEDAFIIDSSGEANPQIVTKNEQREKLNRRVSIKVQNFNNDFSPIPLPLD